MGRSLLDEWDAALSNLNRIGRDRLRSIGVDLDAEVRAGCLGVERITSVGELWHPDPAGRFALLIGIWTPEPPSLLHATSDEFELLDVVATRTDQPSEWWLRIGVEDPVLGEHNAHLAIDAGRPVHLADTPLGWLQAGATGVCDLTWSRRYRHTDPALWEVAA